MSYRWKALSPEHQQVAKYGAFLAPPVMTAMFWSFPAALCYYWTCSNMYTITTELVLRHPRCALIRLALLQALLVAALLESVLHTQCLQLHCVAHACKERQRGLARSQLHALRLMPDKGSKGAAC